ncbi:Ethanolamine utilization protein EutN/carboxysome [Roseovarius litorisediminis]|uniref:Ethanolamine utilization protein EutN/carboxysome n=1 Tax=Roseovarius litorisediminis TaxID=1312363 RepID=A0A1Y5SW08_9RHOB|nr:EutN/CcmL family microcompartment protein [Roseovarius litorisediminis]SLN49655.1 Ethanolamine utilization protein EutN/carboxysome [Roseovarius litorisediminis]
MIRGKVTGRVWSSKHIETMPSGALLEVEVAGSIIVAFDPLGCAEGEEVLITQGSVAAAFFTKQKAPIDALIIGSIDET